MEINFFRQNSFRSDKGILISALAEIFISPATLRNNERRVNRGWRELILKENCYVARR
jgi:hypothetical protein